jgi:hypothetical protein
MTTTERHSATGAILLALDAPPWDTAYRAIIGFSLTPLYARAGGPPSDRWTTLLFLLAVLAAMRVVPGLLRRTLPFPASTRDVWAHRRALAKRFDSYQWRKLLGIGLGWWIYLVSLSTVRHPAQVLASACLIAGVAGAAVWRVRRTEIGSGDSSAERPPKAPQHG